MNGCYNGGLWPWEVVFYSNCVGVGFYFSLNISPVAAPCLVVVFVFNPIQYSVLGLLANDVHMLAGQVTLLE